MESLECTTGGATPAASTRRSTARSFISRSISLNWRGKEDALEPKGPGPLGLTTLSAPIPEQPPVADIVFVHGLNGGSSSTWSKGNNPDCFWPRRWLPEEDGFRDVRIHTFGYPAAVDRGSVLNIRDIAQSLLAAVHDSPLMNQGRQPPLIFVAHSMGGLVVKQAYLLGCQHPELKSVADRVFSILFLATPHQGAVIAQVLSRLTAIIGVRPFVEDLFPQSRTVQSLSEDFPLVCGHLQLFSFYETRPMSVGVKKTLIVEKSSAVMNLPNERRTFLEADHRNVAMYSTREDPSYVSVKNALATILAAQRDICRSQIQPEAAAASEEDRDTQALGRFLDSTDTPSNMDAVYSDILARMEMTRFGNETAKAILTWATYAFRPLHLAEMQMAIEMDIDDEIIDVQSVILKCCGSLLYVDQHGIVQFVHSTAREFFIRGGLQSKLVLTKSDGHRRLAWVCLKALLQVSQKPARRARRLVSVSSVKPPDHKGTDALLTDYASKFLFKHLDHVEDNDEELLLMLSRFLGSNNLLRWIELTAANGDLRTVYDAAKTIKALLRRRARHPSPTGQDSALSQGNLEFLEKWGDDLAHLVPQFSERLRRSPKAIHHHIVPFCPPSSAIRQIFASPMRDFTVQGLSPGGWDDCLTTLRYAQGRSPLSMATASGYLAVGIESPEGRVLVHDDALFQELYSIQHGKPLECLAFAVSGRYLASAGGGTVRIWSPTNGLELAHFELKINARRQCMKFAEDDTILRIATSKNQLVEWDLESNTFLHDEPLSWESDLPERMEGREPILLVLSPVNNLLAVMYKGHDIVFWDCAEGRFYDTYEQKTGSVQIVGSHLQARGWSTVLAAVFSHAADANLFAATFDDGDLVVFDLDAGKPIAVNTEGAYNMELASSHDGRTLASVDKLGNLTLFNFRTLRLLYRVRLETDIMPHGLAFTSDDLRIIEIGKGQCRVWEPGVLCAGTSTYDHDVSLPVPIPIELGALRHHFKTRAAQEITAITCSHEFSVVFYAMGNGSIFGYDISGPAPEMELLFAPESHSDIIALHFDGPGKILAYGNRRDRFAARKVSRRRKNPQEPNAVWEVGSPLIDIQRSGDDLGMLKQILVSSRHERLLVSTAEDGTLWPMPQQVGGGESGGCIRQIKTSEHSIGPRWITCPCPRSPVDLLLGIDEAGQTIKVYDWATFNLLRAVPLLPGFDLSLDRFAPLSHPHYFATYATRTSEPESDIKEKQTAAILLWDFQDLEGAASSQPLAPRWQIVPSTLPSQVVHLIGAFGTRLVFYTADHWIASFELIPPGSIVAEDSFVRHFFLPNSWIGSMELCDMRFGISSEGEIIFDRRGELAVIKRGLEVTEDGSTFHPRQLSSKTRSLFGGRIPSREPGLSVARLQEQGGCDGS
ncbi:hypothetical protein C8A00DRAFT_13901 [Chaetomidium leptoderma]|uniref:GPI inositol-deacylase n=1 Tax=Chaetomidium leptoderma TaxID=669021 RepID=A0AAN6ZZT2_9PEZI|nr:hypothetical protein C8A00DRAFT_13901 [Chaetomidium leptoderma]